MNSENQRLVCVILILCGLTSLHAQTRNPYNATDNNRQTRTTQESFDALATQAQVAMAAERIPEAIALFARATKLRPSWSEGWWHLGTLLFDTGRYPEARTAFGDFLAVEHKQPGPGFAMLGLTEFHLKNYRKALADLERGVQLDLGNNPDFGHTVLYHDGILNTLQKHPEIALVRLTREANLIAAANPSSPRESVFADTDLLDALGMAGLRIAKLPADLDPTQTPVVRAAGRAQALIALQDRVAADTEFQQLLILYPNEPGVHYMYGVFLLKEHPPLAAEQFRHELEVSPSDPAPRIQLAFAGLGTADYDDGLKFAKEAIALDPGNFVSHVVCGRLLLELDKTNDAVTELRTAVKLAPDSPDAHFALSRALAQAGQSAEAARERTTFERLKARATKADKD